MTIPKIGEATNISAARQNAAAAADKLFLPATLPIYSADEMRPDQIGTATLISVGDLRFLLTAAHVLDECEDGGMFTGVDGQFVPIKGQASITSKVAGKRKDDHFDIADIPLGGEPETALAGIAAIDEKWIDWQPVPASGHLFSAFGFPNTRNKITERSSTKIKPEALQHTDCIVDDPGSAKMLPDGGAHHLHLSYGRRANDADGNIQNAIKPRGMSGGPLIDLGKLSDPEVLEGRASTVPKLVAIVTERGVGLNLVCTKMSVIRKILEDTGRL
jgi:hypothetical protein